MEFHHRAGMKSSGVFLILVGGGLAILFFLVMMFIFDKITFLLSGWKKIALRFPARHVKETGEVYKKLTGGVGWVKAQRMSGFDVQLCLDGLAVTPGFARRDPIFIPWSAVNRIEVVDSSVTVRVAYERSMWFWLPHDALENIKARAPFLTIH